MLTGKQRAYLRSLAAKEAVILTIGKAGITDAVVAEAQDALRARELIKGKVLETSLLTPREASDALCELCGADGVQCIGNVFSLYRPADKPRIVLPK